MSDDAQDPHRPEPVRALAPAASVHLTPRRRVLQETARAFATDEVRPVADALDREHADLPEHLLRRMAELGYFGILVPAEHGGLGLGVVDYCVVAEELARAWMSAASIIARGNGTGCEVEDPARRADLLRRSARGERVCAIAFSEPEAGSDLGRAACRAERHPDGGWTVTGTKRWVGHALAADALYLLARTREPGDGRGPSDGLELFLVEKERGSLPVGVTGTPIDKIGYFGITSWQLEVDGLRLPDDALVPSRFGEGQGFKESLTWLDTARVHTAARAVGVARAAVEDAAAYLLGREQFGRPLAEQQVLRHTLADMAAAVAAARQLYLHAAWLVDAGEPATADAAAAKLVASETAERVTGQALQLFGGNGYTTEFSVERYWRDARLTTIFEGTSQIQRMIVSDQLLG